MSTGGVDRVGARARAVRTLIVAGLLAGVAGVGWVAPAADAETIIEAITHMTMVPPPPPPPTTTTTEPWSPVPRRTWLATPNQANIPTYDFPDGHQIGWAGTWYHGPITMPIIESNDRWLLVRLPERPNMTVAWVRRSDVTASTTQYRIVIDRSDKHLTVYENGWPSWSAPVGLGKPKTPTPLGHYYVGVIEAPGPKGYGPIVLDTTAHSETIRSWQGSGDAIIAIHGPINSKSAKQIGTKGTYNTNGCVRMHAADQLRLEGIPVGTPVDIYQ